MPWEVQSVNTCPENFLWEEARKIDPELRQKPGAMYRLNRWREEQITDLRLALENA